MPGKNCFLFILLNIEIQTGQHSGGAADNRGKICPGPGGCDQGLQKHAEENIHWLQSRLSAESKINLTAEDNNNTHQMISSATLRSSTLYTPARCCPRCAPVGQICKV